MFILRPYQQEASDIAVKFLKDDNRKYNAIEVLPTGSGKSLIIADIVRQLEAPTLVFQPSKEILEQNTNKAKSYNIEFSIYSASMNQKVISNLTFATIGSTINNMHLFEHFKYIIIDECHFVNPKQGMYKKFLDSLDNNKVLGLTATPYRLSTDGFGGSILKFLTRTRPRVFKELIYYVQTNDLLKQGFLAKLEYFNILGFERKYLKVNSTGADYTTDSIQRYYNLINFNSKLLDTINILIESGRKKILIFTQFITESEYIKNNIKGCEIVTSSTQKKDRENVINNFKTDVCNIITNVGIFTTGVDFPELDTIVIARPTMSLALYSQMIGRGARPHKDKLYTAVVDLCGNYDLFGRIEDHEIIDQGNSKWIIENTRTKKQLTNAYLGEVNNN